LDKAFELVGSLDENQRFSGDPQNSRQQFSCLARAGRQAHRAAGIKATALSESQQAKLVELIGGGSTSRRMMLRAAKMAEIKANLADTYFAWSGPTTKGSAAYFRVQGLPWLSNTPRKVVVPITSTPWFAILSTTTDKN